MTALDDGRELFIPYVPPAKGNATAIVVAPYPRAVRRTAVLARLRRQPSRVALLEARLARAAFVNAGLRGRLAELIEDRDELVDALIDATDDTARQLGHHHPAVTTVRAILASVER